MSLLQYDVAVIDNSGTLWVWGDINGELYPVRTLTECRSVSAGGKYIVALKTDGTLWAWGRNNYGQLGLGDATQRNTPTQVGTDTDWKQVACGYYHTIALKADGTLWAWGSNGNGQFGLGDTSNRYTPTQVGTASDWKQVACGGNHTLAIKNDGTLWAWGYNYYGQLGLGDTIQRNTPTKVGTASDWKQVACGSAYTLALKTDGTLWAWGNNSSGQLGLGDTSNRYTPVQIPNITAWKLFTNFYGSFVIDSDGNLWGWGRIYIGDGSVLQTYTKPQRIFVPAMVVSRTLHEYSLGVRPDGTLWAWGDNSFGRLGFGDTADRATPTQVGADNDWKQVAGGASHVVAIKTDGTLWAWGRNNYGQLGLGDTTDRTTPIQVGTDSDWKQVACGSVHTVAIKNDGTLWAWGHNDSGQLGLGDTTQRTTPTKVGTASDWKQVACGNVYTLAIKNDGTLWAWGINSHGQLGDGTTDNRSTPTLVPFDITTGLHPIRSGIDSYTRFLILIQDGDQIKAFDPATSSLVAVGPAPATVDYFKNFGMESLNGINQAILEQLTSTGPDILVYAVDETPRNLVVQGVPRPRLVFPTGDISLLEVRAVQSISVATTESGGGLVRLIVSVDQGATWNTWDEETSSWITINENDLTEVRTKGMTAATLAARTADDWSSLIRNSPTIRFAYYLEQAAVSDQASTDELSAQLDLNGYFEMAIPGTEYRYSYPRQGFLRVKLMSDGTYSIRYPALTSNQEEDSTLEDWQDLAPVTVSLPAGGQVTGTIDLPTSFIRILAVELIPSTAFSGFRVRFTEDEEGQVVDYELDTSATTGYMPGATVRDPEQGYDSIPYINAAGLPKLYYEITNLDGAVAGDITLKLRVERA